MNNHQDTFSKVGGKYAISLSLGIRLWPFIVLVVPVLEDSSSLSEFSSWIMASFLSTVPSALLLVISDKTWLRKRAIRAVPSGRILVLGAALGGIRGALLEIIAVKFQLIDNFNFISFATRTLNSALLGMIALPLIAYLLTTYDDFKSENKPLLENLAFIRIRNSQISKLEEVIGETDFQGLVDSINDSMANLRSSLSSKLNDSQPRQADIVREIRDLAQEVIRPLSHILYELSQPKFLNVEFRDVRKVLSKVFRINSLLVTFFYFLFEFKFALSHSVPVRGLFLLLVHTGIVFSTAEVVRHLKVSPSGQVSLLAIFTVGLQLLASAFMGESIEHIKALFDTFWIAGLAFLTGLLTSLNRARALQLETIRDLITHEENLRYRSAISYRQNFRNLSKTLHGVYHSRLIAVAFSIEKADSNQDAAELRGAIRESIDLLDIDLNAFTERESSDISDSLQEIIDKWNGIIDVRTQGLADIEPSRFQSIAIAEVAQEAIANAYRHGRASEVDIQFLALSNGDISLKILDNGVGFIPSPAGLGCAIYAELAGDRWKLESRADTSGTLLTLTLGSNEVTIHE